MYVTDQPIELCDESVWPWPIGSRDGSRKLRPVGMLAALDFAELGLKLPTAVGKVHRLRRHDSPWRAGVCGTRTERRTCPLVALR
jgi:hypothetical protein